MRFALSTNWCNQRLSSGEEIADLAGEIGFNALELGFRTSHEQVAGFKARLDSMPVESVHAFCPVPISAPHGHPELYTLASPDPEARALARIHVANTVRFAADIGAQTVVLHAGRVGLARLFRPLDSRRLQECLKKAGNDVGAAPYAKALAAARRLRAERGKQLMPAFITEIERLLPLLQEKNVILAFENLPYLEGFPDETESAEIRARFSGAPVRAWFDTGHDRVRQCHQWNDEQSRAALSVNDFAGIHINDVVDRSDNHLPPGEGKVDFAALAPMAASVRHRVFEPAPDVARENLEAGLAHLRRLWTDAQ